MKHISTCHMIATWLRSHVTATRGDREAKRIEEPQRQPARQTKYVGYGNKVDLILRLDLTMTSWSLEHVDVPTFFRWKSTLAEHWACAKAIEMWICADTVSADLSMISASEFLRDIDTPRHLREPHWLCSSRPPTARSKAEKRSFPRGRPMKSHEIMKSSTTNSGKSQKITETNRHLDDRLFTPTYHNLAISGHIVAHFHISTKLPQALWIQTFLSWCWRIGINDTMLLYRQGIIYSEWVRCQNYIRDKWSEKKTSVHTILCMIYQSLRYHI